MNLLNLTAKQLYQRRVLIRVDLNLPLDRQGNITSESRLLAALPSIKYALEAQAHVMVMSHFGSPKEGTFSPQYSLSRFIEPLKDALQCPVELISRYLSEPLSLQAGKLFVLENVRFNTGEQSNDTALAQQYAGLCDIFVMDAYAVLHRAQASVAGICQYAQIVVKGALLEKELLAIKRIKTPQKPFLAILGGSKLSTKLPMIRKFIGKADRFMLGGGIANTFLAAQGYNVGQSLYEKEFVDEMKELMTITEFARIDDVIVECNPHAVMVKKVTDITDSDKIYDLGPQTIQSYLQNIPSYKTILWNGPVGAFEDENFSLGTQCLVRSIAHSRAFSLAGGGETIAAIEKFSHADDEFSYCSTGGGAFLAHLSESPMPGLIALESRIGSD